MLPFPKQFAFVLDLMIPEPNFYEKRILYIIFL